MLFLLRTFKRSTIRTISDWSKMLAHGQHINNTSTHQQHINTSTHQHINTSTHQHINTSTHQHINTPTHQHINNTSTHQHINTSTHQHTNASTHQQHINTTETRWNDKNLNAHFSEYQWIGRKAQTPNGGVGFLIHNSILFQRKYEIILGKDSNSIFLLLQSNTHRDTLFALHWFVQIVYNFN